MRIDNRGFRRVRAYSQRTGNFRLKGISTMVPNSQIYLKKIAKFEAELNNNFTRNGKRGGRMLKTKFKLARKRSIC